MTQRLAATVTHRVLEAESGLATDGAVESSAH